MSVLHTVSGEVDAKLDKRRTSGPIAAGINICIFSLLVGLRLNALLTFFIAGINCPTPCLAGLPSPPGRCQSCRGYVLSKVLVW